MRVPKRVIFLLLLVVPPLFFWARYPGFTKGFMAEMRHAKWGEAMENYRFLFYYAEFYAKLARNPETNRFDFSAEEARLRADTQASGLERGRLFYHTGDFSGAVQALEADIRARGPSEERLFWLAAAYLRVGEELNCLANLQQGDTLGGEGDRNGLTQVQAPQRVCVLPFDRPHQAPEGTFRASELFLQLLDEYNADDPLYRWLLNFTHMALGSYPDGVPADYLIDSPFTQAFYGDMAKRVDADFSQIKLDDQAAVLGADVNDAGKGVAVEDFDGDGYFDIITGGTFSNLVHLRNRGEAGGFVDVTEASGLQGVDQCYIITAADYDNDGAFDLFVSRPFQRFMLLHNDGRGNFKDVTLSAGLLKREPTADEATYACVSAWSDVNNDGLLDLFVAQFGQHYPFVGGLLGRNPMRSTLYINNGQGFDDATDAFELGDVVDDAIFLGAAFGDFDNDDDPDLFLSSFTRGKSLLLLNEGGERFRPTDLIETTDPGFMAAFVDVNHDGLLDLFQGSQSSARIVAKNVVLGEDPGRSANKIFIQSEQGFQAKHELFQLSIGTMGANFGDLNNDGCYDFYLGTGNPEGWFMLPNLMYMGEPAGETCSGAMRHISSTNGFGSLQKGHGIVFFDLENDGDLDIYSSLGGMWPADPWPNQLFVNRSENTNHWLQLRLAGKTSNRYGLGARIEVTAKTAGGERLVRTYHMDNQTGFGSAPYLAHMGLMDAVGPVTATVRWPTSKITRSYTLELDRRYRLGEDGHIEELQP